MCATESHPSCCQTLQAEPRDASPAAKPWATPLRPRARRRVLYPPLVRRPPPTERPDRAQRWLLLLSALLFLQIYTEEGSCGAWDPLQAETTATATTQHPLQECEALGHMADLLQWGAPGEPELDLQPCCERSANPPTRAQCAGA